MTKIKKNRDERLNSFKTELVKGEGDGGGESWRGVAVNGKLIRVEKNLILRCSRKGEDELRQKRMRQGTIPLVKKALKFVAKTANLNSVCVVRSVESLELR